MQEELPTPAEEQIDDQRYHFMSLILNLANTFLYMVNTYIIVPTADDYSISLGAAATVCGVVIGSMAVAQVFSSVYFSAWSNRSYFKPLVFSSIVLFLGNLMYAMAYDISSIWVLLLGRLLCGYVTFIPVFYIPLFNLVDSLPKHFFFLNLFSHMYKYYLAHL